MNHSIYEGELNINMVDIFFSEETINHKIPKMIT